MYRSMKIFDKLWLAGMQKWKVKVKVAQSCLTLCDPVDYTVHGILQARILEWVTIPFSRGSFWPRNWTGVSCIAGGFFYQLSYQGSPPGKHACSDGELQGGTLDLRTVSWLIWGRGCCLWSGTQLWWSPSLLLWPPGDFTSHRWNGYRNIIVGLSWWSVGLRFCALTAGHRFDPWSGKFQIPCDTARNQSRKPKQKPSLPHVIWGRICKVAS